MFGNQHERQHRGLPFFGIMFGLGSLVMYWAAWRSVTSGFSPGTVIGSENRWFHDTGLRRPQGQLAVCIGATGRDGVPIMTEIVRSKSHTASPKCRG
jgi:hypothetical protein